jgi:hypothetical protein
MTMRNLTRKILRAISRNESTIDYIVLPSDYYKNLSFLGKKEIFNKQIIRLATGVSLTKTLLKQSRYGTNSATGKGLRRKWQGILPLAVVHISILS